MKKKTTIPKANKAVGRFLSAIDKNFEDLSPESIVDSVLTCQPNGCTGAEAFRWKYLSDEILTKYCEDNSDGRIRRDKAITKMLLSEVSCKRLNDNGIPEFTNKSSIVFRAQQLVANVLGTVDDVYSAMGDHLAFTSGATVCRRKIYGDPYYKYDVTRPLKVSLPAFRVAKLLSNTTPLWREQKWEICDGNVVFTVPKACDIDRAACKEPAGNQLIQSNVGSYIRKRLKLFGVDLNDQSLNQRLAREGSVTGALATLDLKSASDSISQRCVFELLAPSWVDLLDKLRSPYGLLPDGKRVKWEKHSTMGNGYTFELESLIFWALTKATVESEMNTVCQYPSRAPIVSVYGDDIICPSLHYDVVVQTLNAFGFTVNEKKSFSTGPFRESCGGHYYRGINVKPFYIRAPLDSPDRIIWLLNALRRWAADDKGWCDPSVYNLWITIRRKYVPSEFIGGRNLSSISEVVSPEQPRNSLRWVKPDKSIGGYRAVLRWFQYNHHRAWPESIRVTHKIKTLERERIRRTRPDDGLYLDTYFPLETPTDTSYIDQDARYIDRNDPSEARVVDFHSIVDVGSRDILRVMRYVPTLVETAWFPQEAVLGFPNPSLYA